MQQDPLKKLYGRDLDADTVIFREGERGDKFYLIQSGQVKIAKNLGERHEVVLTTLGPGDFFGEMALFELETRSASAVATTATTVFELGQRTFEDFIIHKPRIAYEIIQKLCQRIRRMNVKAVEEQSRTLPAATAPAQVVLAVRLILLATAMSGSVQSGCVVSRPVVDLARLSALYETDLTQLSPLLAPLATARFASDLLADTASVDLSAFPALRRILAGTMIGAEIVDSRRRDRRS
jgi:CRP-like cAMP-binding protein